jgi:hypothetical protein
MIGSGESLSNVLVNCSDMICMGSFWSIYETEQSESSLNVIVSPAQSSSTSKQSQPKSVASSIWLTIVFHHTPAFCIAVIQKQMEHGRYVLDCARDQPEGTHVDK